MIFSWVASAFAEESGDPPVAHHGDAVGHPEDLLHLGGDHDDRLALVGELVEQVVDLLLRADVDAPGGLVEDQDVAVALQPLGQHDLLLVAAGEVADRWPTDGVLVRSASTHFSSATLRILPSCRIAVLGELRDGGQHRVGGDVLGEDQAVALAVLRQVADALLDGRLRVVDVDLLAVDRHLATGLGVGADQRAGRLGTPRAHQAGEAEDLALLEGEAHVAQQLAPSRGPGPRGPARVRARLGTNVRTRSSRPTISWMMSGWRASSRHARRPARRRGAP